MSTKGTRGRLWGSRHQQGIALVEFGLTALVFFTFMFGMIEVARAMFLWNTLPEVTRRAARAAAFTDFTNAPALAAVRNDAVLRTTPGTLVLGGDISDANVRIDYLSVSTAGVMAPVATMPACPTRNAINCMTNPNGTNCIRLVRARLCQPDADACTSVPYTPLVGLVGRLLSPGTLNFPSFSTVVAAETLGYTAGMPDCP